MMTFDQGLRGPNGYRVVGTLARHQAYLVLTNITVTLADGERVAGDNTPWVEMRWAPGARVFLDALDVPGLVAQGAIVAVP